jgi:hypothetical protein
MVLTTKGKLVKLRDAQGSQAGSHSTEAPGGHGFERIRTNWKLILNWWTTADDPFTGVVPPCSSGLFLVFEASQTTYEL